MSIDLAFRLELFYIYVKIDLEKALEPATDEYWNPSHADSQPKRHHPAAVKPTLWHCRVVPLKN
jgi:hypothetical protein